MSKSRILCLFDAIFQQASNDDFLKFWFYVNNKIHFIVSHGWNQEIKTSLS